MRQQRESKYLCRYPEFVQFLASGVIHLLMIFLPALTLGYESASEYPAGTRLFSGFNDRHPDGARGNY